MESSDDNLSDSSVCSDDSDTGVGTYGSVSKHQANTAKKQIQKEKKKLKQQEKRKAKNKLTSADIYSKTLEFKTWLLEEKSIDLTSLPDAKAKTYFKKFVKKWNNKKLDKKYYRGIDSCPASQANTQHSLSLSLWHTPPPIGPSIPQKPRFAGIHSSHVINRSPVQPVPSSPIQPRSFIQNLGSFINDPENEEFVTLQDPNKPKNDFLNGVTNSIDDTTSHDKFGTFGKALASGRQHPTLNQVFNSTLTRTRGPDLTLKSQENDELYRRPIPVPCIEVPESVQSSYLSSPNRNPIETHLRINTDELGHTYARVNVNKEQTDSISADSGLFDMQVEKPDDIIVSKSPPDQIVVSTSPLMAQNDTLFCSPKPPVTFRGQSTDPCTSKQTFEGPFSKLSTMQLLSQNWEAGLDEVSNDVIPHNTAGNRNSGIHYATACVPKFSTYGDDDDIYSTPLDAIVDHTFNKTSITNESDDHTKQQAEDAKEQIVADPIEDQTDGTGNKKEAIGDYKTDSQGNSAKDLISVTSQESDSSLYSNISNSVQSSHENQIPNSTESFTSLKSQEIKSDESFSSKTSNESLPSHFSQSSDLSTSGHGTKLSNCSDSLTSLKSQASDAKTHLSNSDESLTSLSNFNASLRSFKSIASDSTTKLSSSSESLTSFKSQASDSSAASMYANSEVFLPNESEKLAKCVSPFKALEPSELDQQFAKLNSPRKSTSRVASPLRKAMEENLVYVNTNVCNVNVYKNQKSGPCSSFKTDIKPDLKPMIVDVRSSESKAKESTPEAVYTNTDFIQQALSDRDAAKALIVNSAMTEQTPGNRPAEVAYCNTHELMNAQERTSDIINPDTHLNPSCVNSTPEKSMKTFNTFGKSDSMNTTPKSILKKGAAHKTEQRERTTYTVDHSQSQIPTSLPPVSQHPETKPIAKDCRPAIKPKPSLKSKPFPNSQGIQSGYCQTVAMETCDNMNDQKMVQKENTENISPGGSRKRKILEQLNSPKVSNNQQHENHDRPNKSPKQDSTVEDMIAQAKARQDREKAKIKELMELARSPLTPTKKKHLLWL